jgi:hypothetical protein
LNQNVTVRISAVPAELEVSPFQPKNLSLSQPSSKSYQEERVIFGTVTLCSRQERLGFRGFHRLSLVLWFVALHESAQSECWVTDQDSILNRRAQYDSKRSNRKANCVFHQSSFRQFRHEALDVVAGDVANFLLPETRDYVASLVVAIEVDR